MRKSISFFLGAIILMSGTSCLTQPVRIIASSEVPVITEIDDITVSLTILHDEELVSQFGEQGNVFAEFPALIQKRRNIAYKLDIHSTDSEISINLRNIILKIDDVSSQSKYSTQLIDAWSSYLKTEEEQKAAEELTKTYMHNNNISIKPGESSSGIIVFLAKYPTKGASSMRIGIKDSEGNLRELLIPLTDK